MNAGTNNEKEGSANGMENKKEEKNRNAPKHETTARPRATSQYKEAPGKITCRHSNPTGTFQRTAKQTKFLLGRFWSHLLKYNGFQTARPGYIPDDMLLKYIANAHFASERSAELMFVGVRRAG